MLNIVIAYDLCPVSHTATLREIIPQEFLGFLQLPILESLVLPQLLPLISLILFARRGTLLARNLLGLGPIETRSATLLCLCWDVHWGL